MDTEQPNISQQPAVPIPTSSVPVQPVPPKRLRMLLIGALVLLLVLVGTALVAGAIFHPKQIEVQAPQVSPTPTPTPVITRALSGVATTSAFLDLEASVASLSASLSTTNLDDTSIAPPTIDLSLGFSN